MISYTTINILEQIRDDMMSGNWGTAQTDYKATNVTPRELSEWLSIQELDAVEDFALLGFYTRDYQPIEGGCYEKV
jgi:hypothetical protein